MTQITEQSLKKIEVRLNDIIRLEESIRELNSLMLTAAVNVDFHVRTSHYIYSIATCIGLFRYLLMST